MNLPQNCTVYWMTPPDLAPEAGKFGQPLAHMAYRVGAGMRLTRSRMQVLPRGGGMVLDSRGFDGRGVPEVFCREVIQECAARGFDRVFCDFEGQVPPALKKVLQNLAGLFAKRGWSLYVPESCGADAPPGAKVVVSSAISGGSLQQRLEDAVAAYGQGRVALGLERVAEDFTLPAATGEGRHMEQEELRQLIRDRSPAIFFSKELCAHYFTFMRPGESAHFILYDDAASMIKKLQIAANLDISDTFMPYPGNRDLMEALFPIKNPAD